MGILSRVTAAAAVVLLLTSCGSDPQAAAGNPTWPSPIRVVASTNVWGDVAAEIGGDQVVVTSLFTDPAADPHSFEPNGQSQLALSKAALVVQNGGGYDDYLQQMVESANLTAPVINAVEASGKQPIDGEL